MIGIASNLWIVERAKSVTAISVYKHCKPRCAATLIMIDTSAFVVFLLGNIEEALCWLSQCCEYQEELNHLFFPSFAMLCRFVFFYISFVSGIFPRLTDSFQVFWAHYVPSATLPNCTERKRGTISLDGMSFSKKKKITQITYLPFKYFTANIIGFNFWCSVQPFDPVTGLW